jgi:translation elongation factor EF-4
MVSEEAVKQHIATAVRKADLDTVSARHIRRTVEKQLDLDQDELSSAKWKPIVTSVIDQTVASIHDAKRASHQDEDKQEEDEDVAARMLFFD